MAKAFESTQGIQVFSMVPSRDRNVPRLIEQVYPAFHRVYPDDKSVIFNNSLVAAVPVVDGRYTSDTMDSLVELAKTHNVNIGISLPMRDLFDFLPGYLQSRSAIELGMIFDPAYSVYEYTDYQFFDMLMRFPDKNQLRSYIDPALMILEKFDQENQTELNKTLRVYLQWNCQLLKTAQQLFIHRNSLSRRLEKITELCHIDWNDHHNLFNILVSYKISHFLEQYNKAAD